MSYISETYLEEMFGDLSKLFSLSEGDFDKLILFENDLQEILNSTMTPTQKQKFIEGDFDEIDIELLLNEGILGDISSFVKDKILAIKTMLTTKKKLLAQNEVDIEKLKSNAKDLAKQAINEMKPYVKQQNFGGIASVGKKYISQIGKIIADAIKPELSASGIFKVVLLCAACVVLNSFFYMIATGILMMPPLLFGTAAAGLFGMGLTAIVSGPLVEETAKYISIKLGVGGTFLLGFNIMEFTMHFKQLSAQGFKTGTIIVARGAAVAMHYSTGIVQKYFSNLGKGRLGLALGMLIHFIWNGMAIASQMVTVGGQIKTSGTTWGQFVKQR